MSNNKGVMHRGSKDFGLRGTDNGDTLGIKKTGYQTRGSD